MKTVIATVGSKPTLFILSFLLFLPGLVLQSCSPASPSYPETVTTRQSGKKYDLVLIHGLANRHKWSGNFLETCLQIWGSGRVFVVHTGSERGVAKQDLHDMTLFIGGGDGSQAGIDSLADQTKNLADTIALLHNEYGLHVPFSIIAHSMGGLVARKFIFDNPGKVAGLVTLGTPHHGSALANSFQWIGHFLNATKAIEDLKPENVSLFNKRYPVENTPLAVNEKVFLIRGVPEGKDCFGWAGELLLGWQILSKFHDTASDGLVPYDSAVIDGADLIGDFPHLDHYDLVQQPAVVLKAAAYLP